MKFLTISLLIPNFNVYQAIMRLILTILLTLIAFVSFTQKIEKQVDISNNVPKSNIIGIDNQVHDFKRFEGKISIVDNYTYRFDDKVMLISYASSDLKKILEIGILYPEIFIETGGDKPIFVDKSDTSVIISKYPDKYSFNSFFSSDSLRISDFRELKNPDNSYKVRKFVFLLFLNGFMNPTEYFIELTNEYATKDTDILVFINGSQLTRIRKGSILI
jgi:hypothetical protein